FLEVEVLPAPFITGYRVERPHLEATYFVEAFDDAFRDPVAEVLSLGVPCNILEGQDRESFNCLGFFRRLTDLGTIITSGQQIYRHTNHTYHQYSRRDAQQPPRYTAGRGQTLKRGIARRGVQG